MKAVILFLGVVGVAVAYPWGIPQQVQDTPEVAAAKAEHLAAHAHARYTSPLWVGAQDRQWEGSEDDGSWRGDGNEGSWNGNGNEGSWNGNGNEGSWNGNGNAGSWNGNGNGGSWNGNGNGGSWNGNNGGAWNGNEGSWNQGSDDGSWRDDESWKNYDDGSYKGEAQSWNQDSGSNWGGQSWNRASSGHHSDEHQKKWTGPVALPPGYDKNGAPLPVKDTPEVEAAKAKHYHLYHHAAAHAAQPTHGSWHHH